MAAPQQMLSVINAHKTELEHALGAQAPKFFARVAKLEARLQKAGDDWDSLSGVVDALTALIKRYPAAARLLLAVEPAILTRCEEPATAGAEPPINFTLPVRPEIAHITSIESLPDRITVPDSVHSLDPGIGIIAATGADEAGGGSGTVRSLDPGLESIITEALPEDLPLRPTATETPQIPPDRVVQRYADVEAPASVAPEQTFTLTVALTRNPPSDQPHATPVNVRVTDTAAGPTGAPPVTVLVYATAFAIDGAAKAALHIYEDKDSETARFTLRPKPGISGEQQISVTFLQGGINIVGRVLVGVQVGTRAAARITYNLPVGLSGSPDGAGPAAEPDVILWVDRLVQNGRDYLHFRYMWPQKGQRDPMDADPPIELNQVEAYAQDLYAQLSKCAAFVPPPGAPSDAGVQSAVAAAERALKKIGANLYEQLFPQPLKDFYKQFAPEAQTILIYSTEPWIPWEIVLPNDPALADRDCEFLCARFQVARWLIPDQEATQPRGVPSAVHVRQVCPITPPVGLGAPQDERIYLGNLKQTWPPLTVCDPLPRTAADVLAAMAGGQVNLFHVATHGQFATGAPGDSAILFSADGTDRLTPDDIFEPAVRRGLAQAAPFVFVNACHSGRQGLALAGLGGWVDKFLRNGCSGFVGSNWEVQDDLAAQFAVAFYENLRAGKTFGAACLAARAQIRAANPGNSTWLAYVLYAHPDGSLTAQ